MDVDLLDSLMRLVGELVLTRNQVVAFAGSSAEPDLVQASQRLNVIASELQEGVMKTRMQPIDNVWSKLPRVVRDLAQTCGREVDLVLEGRETELDKTILEAIKDPLTHLVRNAVDHGIEPPDVRVARGKPRVGTLRMRAFHESGRVNIEISDDGAGIDPQRVAAKAVEKGLLPTAEARRMNDKQLRELIFLPGFSTAASISNVSGRGVGMDVVKTNIENIGGSVDIVAPPEGGTTFRIAIPLTLAIIPAVTVECGGACYAVPQVSLVELVSVEPDSASIEDLGGVPVYRLRERLLPLVKLADALRLDDRGDDDRAATIAVLQADGQQFGLLVDRVLDTEEIVVKPLSDQVKRIAEFAGATILGDGRVALILDTMALARNTGVLGSSVTRETAAQVETAAADDESHLVLGLDDGRRVAVPTGAVTRLEQFPAHLIERTGSREVIQYRGEILPLVRLSAHLGAYGDVDPEAPVRVVVYTAGGRSVGLVVASIVDITHGGVTAVSDLDGLGVTGSAVIQDRVTEILDVRAAILGADPRFFDADTRSDVPQLTGAP
ncbi:chemotaxis protein CheW [Nocardioides zeae]